MNWTGGSRRRFSSKYASKSTRAQKKYFARVRTGSTNVSAERAERCGKMLGLTREGSCSSPARGLEREVEIEEGVVRPYFDIVAGTEREGGKREAVSERYPQEEERREEEDDEIVEPLLPVPKISSGFVQRSSTRIHTQKSVVSKGKVSKDKNKNRISPTSLEVKKKSLIEEVGKRNSWVLGGIAPAWRDKGKDKSYQDLRERGKRSKESFVARQEAVSGIDLEGSSGSDSDPFVYLEVGDSRNYAKGKMQVEHERRRLQFTMEEIEQAVDGNNKSRIRSKSFSEDFCSEMWPTSKRSSVIGNGPPSVSDGGDAGVDGEDEWRELLGGMGEVEEVSILDSKLYKAAGVTTSLIPIPNKAKRKGIDGDELWRSFVLGALPNEDFETGGVEDSVAPARPKKRRRLIDTERGDKQEL